LIAEAVQPFESRVTLAKLPGDITIDARSILSIVGLDVKLGDECVLRADGPDAEAVIVAMRDFVHNELAKADDLPPPDLSATSPTRSELPVCLRRAAPRFTTGRPVSSGIAFGQVVVVGGLELSAAAKSAKPVSVESELSKAQQAMNAVRDDLLARAATAPPGMQQELLRAHSGIANDPAMVIEIERGVRRGLTALQAVVAAAERFATHLRTAQSAYIRDRAIDVQDVAMQLADRLDPSGKGIDSLNVVLNGPSVIFAEALTANQLLRMDRSHLGGLVLGAIGATSHTVILARSLQIPTLIDVENPTAFATKGTRVVLDASVIARHGLVLESGAAVDAYYAGEQAAHARRSARLAPFAQEPAVTADGVTLEVGVNATAESEIANATRAGADGVGLMRTELLFLDREAAPTEQEQFEVYAAAARAAGGRPVIIRTFDIGGDKPATYLRMPREENPFLGRRGLRLYQCHPKLLHTQLRAIVRASAMGKIKVMAPMVSLPEEAAWFRAQVRSVQEELSRESIPFDACMPVGIMIEVPSTAMVMDQLGEEVDFFSIGTNDLCQYWMAVDRGNPGVAPLYNPFHPTFLRLLRAIVDGARAGGKWIGVCGEMGGNTSALPIMIGLGVNEISASPSDVVALKTAVHGANAARCREALDAAARCRTEFEVIALLAKGSWRDAKQQPILDREMIEVEHPAHSKEEAIKAAVDLLLIAGRSDKPRHVETAVWAREATYSTGLGYGFAVPHCKTDAVCAPTLAVLKLKDPVEWGSMDGQPVGVVLLLAIPASDTTGAHMKVFAKLARKLMHEGFRERMVAAADSAAVHACLAEELDLQ
jgi:fructose-specific PTS system IIA-like component